VVDLYPKNNNCIIISQKELTNYYGMAFAPRLTISLSKIEISLVSKIELQQIKHIGPISAQKIIDFREIKTNKCTFSNIQSILGLNDNEMKSLEDHLIFEKDV